MGGKLFALDKDCTVFDKGILEAVTGGIGIDTEQAQLGRTSRNEKTKIIDITNL